MDWAGYRSRYVITLGYYDDGRLGEVFINGGKSGEMVEAIARDAAVLLSMAMQHGVPIDALAKTVTRDSQGNPGSIAGAVIDEIMRREKEAAKPVG